MGSRCQNILGTEVLKQTASAWLYQAMGSAPSGHVVYQTGQGGLLHLVSMSGPRLRIVFTCSMGQMLHMCATTAETVDGKSLADLIPGTFRNRGYRPR